MHRAHRTSLVFEAGTADDGALRRREDIGGREGEGRRAVVRRGVRRGKAYGRRRCPEGLLGIP